MADIASLTRGMVELDERSYEDFFALYYHRLWAYLSVISDGSEDDSEELLQCVFEKIVKNIRTFNDEGAFWAWLATIAKNTYLDSRRKHGRFNRFKEGLLNLIQLFNREDEAEQHITQLSLEQAMTTLSEAERHLIVSRYYCGESHRAIAAELNTSEKAVESKLARVRSKLREQLLQP